MQAGCGFVPAELHLNENDGNRVTEAERKQHKGPKGPGTDQDPGEKKRRADGHNGTIPLLMALIYYTCLKTPNIV